MLSKVLGGPNQNKKMASYSRTDWVLLGIRLILGITFMLHGSQLLFGAFNGGGLTATMSAKGPGGGGTIGLLVAIGQFFGGLGILLGFLSRFSAVTISIIMLDALLIIHFSHGFFIQEGGFEYTLALIGLSLPIVILGPGALNIGRFLPLLPKHAVTGQPVLVLE
jgi:putative oxidoreductase